MAASTGSSGWRARGGMITGINVTPLVDIMLVLLIIFMVTATHIVRKSIVVDLPEAKSGETAVVTRLNFIVEKGGRTTLGGREVNGDAVRQAVRSHKQEGTRLEAVVAADKAVPHGDVVHLIDILREEGVLRLGINVVQPPPKQ